MKNVPIRLGPLALLLCVITICMTTLAMLSVSEASADLRLAERYAQTVRIRYELEEEGQRFMMEADRDPGAAVLQREFEQDGYTLTVELTLKDGRYTPTLWKLRKEWDEVTEIDDLWQGD